MADVIIGTHTTPQGVQPLSIKSRDRRHHVYILGKSGSGKSTLIRNMTIQDMRNGCGVGLIDPHGDLIEDVLNYVPRSRTNDVVYFNPADAEYPVGLNLLEVKDGQNKELVASSLVSVFRHLWADSWGPRTEYVLYNTVAALMDSKGSTLLDVYRMLVDGQFRKAVVAKIQDPIIRLYWKDVFPKYSDRFASEVFSPIQNKVGQLLSGSYLRNIVGQPKGTIDFRKVLDDGLILLVNLSKGRIGEDRANLLGSVIITKLYLTALERQHVSEAGRKDFYLYIDEAHSFSSDVFSSILSEARKYRLNLSISHQYLDQMPRDTLHSIFGNLGSWIVFRVGSSDADVLEKEFQPYIKVEILRRQKNHRVVYKLLVDGSVAIPGMTTTLPPLEPLGDEANRETLIRVSRERFALPRDKVERHIEEVWNTEPASTKKRPR